MLKKAEEERLPAPITMLFTLLCLLLPPGNVAGEALDDWTAESQREEIRPLFNREQNLLFKGEPTISISGNGEPSANGWWSRLVDVSPGGYFLFKTNFIAEKVEDPGRSVLARIVWLDKEGLPTGHPEYPPAQPAADSRGWTAIQHACQAPENAVKAKLELVFRWDADGRVRFGGTSLAETSPPQPREVKIAAIHFRPRNSASSLENLERFAGFIRQAAGRDADIVCLPEGITMVGTQMSYLEAGEPVPGPTTDFMGGVAREHGLYLVVNLYEREHEAVYNTSVLLDRTGGIAGTYRKVCLPREEIDGGLTPGESFPVFETDFGKIGMMTCWDLFFPEAARALAGKGAEIIFLPIWGGNLTLAEARAIENQVYLTTSSYDMKTGVFDLEGELIVEGTEAHPVAMVSINLNQRKIWPWLGDFRNRIPREKPPSS